MDLAKERLNSEDEDLLVIVPYRYQKHIMEEAFSLLGWHVAVSTVDRFQGSEADKVFLGLARTEVLPFEPSAIENGVSQSIWIDQWI